jgi:hypothetical protein
MKTIKAMCVATLLALSLSISAYADTAPGDGHNPGKPAMVPSVERPIGTPENPGSTGLSAVDGDVGILSITDIVWALASMF